jgi:hypothetical protein
MLVPVLPSFVAVSDTGSPSALNSTLSVSIWGTAVLSDSLLAFASAEIEFEFVFEFTFVIDA